MFKEDTFATVINISPRPTAKGELDIHAALPALARVVALDTRVYVDVIRGNSGRQVVQCYQFKSRILFTLYDPIASRWDYCFTNIEGVGKLLEPNFCDEESFNIRFPPRTRDQLYRQLVQLLHYRRCVSLTQIIGMTCFLSSLSDTCYDPCYRRVWKDGVKSHELVCDRDPSPLFQTTRKISGHEVRLVAYEKGKGELGFDVQVPERGRGVSECLISFSQLIDLHGRGDREHERPAIEGLASDTFTPTDDIDINDVESRIVRVLHPVMERLIMRPTALSVIERGLGSR